MIFLFCEYSPNVDFLTSGSEPLAINFPMKSSQCQSPFPFLTSFPSIYAQLVSKSTWWRWTRTPAPFLPHFISLARFILCFYRIYGKIRGFSKTVNLRNSSTAYHRNTFHTAVCKKSGLRFMFFFLFSVYCNMIPSLLDSTGKIFSKLSFSQYHANIATEKCNFNIYWL